MQFSLIHESNIPGSYTILFVAALNFSFITRHIHNWVSYPVWPRRFMHSGAIGNSPPLLPSGILNTFRPGGLIFWCHIFLAFYAIHEILPASVLGWFAIPPPVDHVFSELSAMTCLSWVALHSMAHSFIDLFKPLHQDKAVIHEGGSCIVLHYLST